jgi:histidinol phosphatase-like enzyme (inositol monophosphatase family)
LEALRARLSLARRIAVEAEWLALKWYQSPELAVETKPDGSVVTAVDKDTERMIRDAVASAFPDDSVLGEEFGETAGGSGFRWVVDPIDGTGSYVRGLPTFATLIGIEHEGVARAGLASFPALGEVVSGGPGIGDGGLPDALWRTRLRGTAEASVSGVRELSSALIESTRAEKFAKAGLGDVFGRISAATSKIRGWDDAFAFAMVATGRSEAAVGMNMNLWDVAAFVPVVQAAGGAMTAWDGVSATDGSRTLCSNGALHDDLTRILSAG